MNLTLTFEARADLTEIWRYIARDDEETADQFIDKLHNECLQIAKLSSVGRNRSELRRGVQSLFFKRYVIFFRRKGEETTILRILHGARDQSKVFEG